MKRIPRTPGASGGFSLIEVMIAVVVLATGLLALSALQASLTRSAAEARVRSRVAAMLTARMDELRGSGYDNAVLNPTGNDGITVTSTTGACDDGATDWIDCAREQANLGSLEVVQTNTLWTGSVGGTSFSTVSSRTAIPEGNPEFIRVNLEARWTDASGDTRSLALSSEFSALALRDSLLPPPPRSNTPTGGPVVRTDNPATPGVIPIAVGGGDATAASNPRPELIGKNNNTTVTGTRFDVLTYEGLTGAATIQRRVETAVVKCQCRLGAGGDNLGAIYRESQWPAIWTGERYDLYRPEEPDVLPPGQGQNSGPKPGVDQSPLCQECCRDHFDGDSNSYAKFDPERSGSHQHYKAQGALLTPLATGDTDYVESCRVIRVDGFWRTAADMYSRQFGLLATETDSSGRAAATGLPSTTASTNYQTFVKDYLSQITGNTGSPPTNAQTTFDETARGLNNPAEVLIANPSSTDYRYLHGRGLYVDYMEQKVRDKIASVVEYFGEHQKCPSGPVGTVTATDAAECLLPYIPFTTINVTELARWTETNPSPSIGTLIINSGGILGTLPNQPSGGRTIGVKKGRADNQARINLSNFGVAASSDTVFNSIAGVDATDATAVGTDAQTFRVGGDSSPDSSGDRFTVAISGVTTQDPDVFYTVPVGGADTSECLSPGSDGNYACATNTTPITNGTIRVTNYWIETTTSRSVTVMCRRNGDATDLISATDTLSVPTFRDFTVTSATVGLLPGQIQDPVSNDKKRNESVTITFATGLVAGSAVQLVLTPQTLVDAEQYATIASGNCDTNGGGNRITNVTWTKPWDAP